MDGVTNVAKHQQAQVKPEASGGAVQHIEQLKNVGAAKEAQKDVASTDNTVSKVTTEKDVQDLVKQLNDAMSPMSTNIKFGVDSHDVFFVSVVDSESGKMIRRFPAEQAESFLPKMKEVTGILFDSKG